MYNILHVYITDTQEEMADASVRKLEEAEKGRGRV